MCKAVELAETMDYVLQEAVNERKRLSSKISTLEQAEQDLLHDIEDGKASRKAFQYNEALNKLRTKRRDFKNELQPLQYLIDSINPQRANTYISKVKEIYDRMNTKTVYNYEPKQIHRKTNVLEQVNKLLKTIG